MKTNGPNDMGKSTVSTDERDGIQDENEQI